MKQGYKKRFALIRDLITGVTLKEHARKAGGHTFSRERKLPLLELLVCTLSKKGLTTEMELRNYYESRTRLCSFLHNDTL